MSQKPVIKVFIEKHKVHGRAKRKNTSFSPSRCKIFKTYSKKSSTTPDVKK